ncbi:MAG TPA: NADH-quinone oxidoreductase subunit J [Steroidobacteraceae bacterium]|nr:NADH-quinone oxidoreductase subunit J [Steroidobacteraceae bacterium]
MFVEILFYAFAAVLIGAGVGVITARNPVHCALFLVLAFFTSAAIWLLLEAEFLAIVLVLVYVGAVMVLFLFVVMMLDVNIEELRQGFTRYAPLGVIVALIMIAEIVNVVWVKHLGQTAMSASPPLPADYSNTKELGAILYTEYAYPFQIAAVILLVAIIAAIVLTMRHRAGLKVQDISMQVAARREDRVRVIKMESEKAP